jgi:hypothetical protein
MKLRYSLFIVFFFFYSGVTVLFSEALKRSSAPLQWKAMEGCAIESLDHKGSAEVRMHNSRSALFSLSGPFDWRGYDKVLITISFPEEASMPVECTPYLKDFQWRWFQGSATMLQPGDRKSIELDLNAESGQWRSEGHLKAWDAYSKRDIAECGLSLTFPSSSSDTFFIEVWFQPVGPEDTELYFCEFRDGPPCVGKYKLFEATFELSQSVDDPFDVEKAKVEGIFSSPSGRTIRVPGFFSHDFLRSLDSSGEELYAAGRSEWKIRFTPEEEGEWRYRIEACKGEEKISTAIRKFFVEKSAYRGFIRWDSEDPHWLSFSDGTFMYPIGHTLRSPDDLRTAYPYEFMVEKNQGTYAYDSYFPLMKAAGENYARIWSSAWWLGLEWNPSYGRHYRGLGQYSLENAWRLDYLLERAREAGIFFTLTLANHGQLSIRPDAEWWDNPYNILNGGMLSSPEEFFTNEQAREYLKKRLYYSTARWAYSPNIAFWELWNEVDLTSGYSTLQVRKWHQEIISFLRSIDPWNHLTTTHYCRRDVDPYVWPIPELESLVGNAYDVCQVSSMRNYWKVRSVFQKPMMVNEFGVGRTRTLLENNLHAGIWSSSMLPMFGSALFWWWPFIHHYDLYFHYRAFSLFWDGEDRRKKGYQVAGITVSGNPWVDAIGIRNEESGFIWVYDTRLYNIRVPAEISERLQGSKLFFPGFEEGLYFIEIWDPWTGTITLQRKENLGKDASFLLPDFSRDIAIKIRRIDMQ